MIALLGGKTEDEEPNNDGDAVVDHKERHTYSKHEYILKYNLEDYLIALLCRDSEIYDRPQCKGKCAIVLKVNMYVNYGLVTHWDMSKLPTIKKKVNHVFFEGSGRWET